MAGTCRARRVAMLVGILGAGRRVLGWHTCGRKAGHRGVHKCSVNNVGYHCAVTWRNKVKKGGRK